MTPEEMTTVARIMLTADSWCSNCQHDLFDLLRQAFPNHAADIDAVFSQRRDLEEAHRKAYYEWIENMQGDPPTVLSMRP